MTTNDPAVDGFLSGTYSDGAPLYPGVGFFAGVFSSCGYGDRPARVYKDPPAAYGPCVTGDGLTNYGVKFFASHVNLKWTAVNWTTYKNLPGALGVIEAQDHDINGYYYVTRHNRTGYQQIGAFCLVCGGTNNGNSGPFFWDGTQLNFWDTNWEVLTCL